MFHCSDIFLLFFFKPTLSFFSLLKNLTFTKMFTTSRGHLLFAEIVFSVGSCPLSAETLHVFFEIFSHIFQLPPIGLWMGKTRILWILSLSNHRVFSPRRLRPGTFVWSFLAMNPHAHTCISACFEDFIVLNFPHSYVPKNS